MSRAGLAIAALCLLAMGEAGAGDSMVLWRIVHDQCVVDEKANGAPAPCARVAIADGEDRGVAILKDINGIAQYLAIPTTRVEGIESPALLEPGAPNYWAPAWAARALVNARLPRELPREAIGLAINAANRRSQNQLHIHIDCVAPEVRDALAAHIAEISSDWRETAFPLKGRRYQARRLASTDLSNAAPFQLLADGVPGAKANMGLETLAAIGATFAPGEEGFVLLADSSDLVGGGHSEDLLDHSCSIASR